MIVLNLRVSNLSLPRSSTRSEPGHEIPRFMFISLSAVNCINNQAKRIGITRNTIYQFQIFIKSNHATFEAPFQKHQTVAEPIIKYIHLGSKHTTQQNSACWNSGVGRGRNKFKLTAASLFLFFDNYYPAHSCALSVKIAVFQINI